MDKILELLVGVFVLILGITMVTVGHRVKTQCASVSSTVQGEAGFIRDIGYAVAAVGGIVAVYALFLEFGA